MALGGILANRCFAIGDIHGHVSALNRLLSVLEKEANLSKDDLLLFLGDYVDRGPDSLGVIERLRALQWERPSTICLLGNHDFWQSVRTLPREAVHWLRSLPQHFEWERYFFSHAPVYRFPPAQSWAAKNLRDFEPIESFRDAVERGYDFLNSYQGFSSEDLLHEPGRIGVCGHVHHPEVVIYPDHYLGVDSGCGFGGKLSAISLPDHRVWSVRESE